MGKHFYTALAYPLKPVLDPHSHRPTWSLTYVAPSGQHRTRLFLTWNDRWNFVRDYCNPIVPWNEG